ncbi:BatD family protein [Luteimonas sp. A277]
MFRPLPTALLLIALLTLLSALPARADTRAWLDRDRIAFGETATLNVETDQDGVTTPDWSPLDADFEVSGHTSTRRVEEVNGQARTQSLFAVALRPRREGVFTIAPLQVHQERTAALTLTVVPAENVPAQAGADAFIEAELDTGQVWVQQAVGYVLRLYYATPLVSGQLEQSQPEGAALQRIGDDLQYSREIAGRRYSVVERRFLLVPERSGELEIPPARFRGRGAGGFFDDMFGSGPRSLRATGESQRLQVRPMPDAAPTPWLPLRGLEARFVEAPQTARAGEALEVVVELRADGATAAQMPQPALRADNGAQVFAEPPAMQEHFDRGRPQVVLTRRFSILPRQAGRLQVEVQPFEWWDAQVGVARTVALPPLVITVAGGGPAYVAGDERWIRVPGVQGEVRSWAVATAAFAFLWLGTLMWALHRRPVPSLPRKGGSAALPTLGGANRAGMRRLRLSLDTGDLGEVEQALCGLASPPAADLDALRTRLGDPAQVAAIEGLQRARWADGEPAKARAGVRTAFAKGPRWASADTVQRLSDPVPPLYPE